MLDVHNGYSHRLSSVIMITDLNLSTAISNRAYMREFVGALTKPSRCVPRDVIRCRYCSA